MASTTQHTSDQSAHSPPPPAPLPRDSKRYKITSLWAGGPAGANCQTDKAPARALRHTSHVAPTRDSMCEAHETSLWKGGRRGPAGRSDGRDSTCTKEGGVAYTPPAGKATHRGAGTRPCKIAGEEGRRERAANSALSARLRRRSGRAAAQDSQKERRGRAANSAQNARR